MWRRCGSSRPKRGGFGSLGRLRGRLREERRRLRRRRLFLLLALVTLVVPVVIVLLVYRQSASACARRCGAAGCGRACVFTQVLLARVLHVTVREPWHVEGWLVRRIELLNSRHTLAAVAPFDNHARVDGVSLLGSLGCGHGGFGF